ncbi:MAG: HAMP domain-containing histidine kinase [Clostridia bacterium]|nr:HAMP domain-containing histidine kinase [Clostridia bacterium]MBR2176718.1 HAMP domain-containing histidine kinase [Clostridia bacterium]
MIKRLQRKIIVLITVLLTAVILIVMFSINIIAQFQSKTQIDQKLERLANNNGLISRSKIDPYLDEEDSFADTLSVMLNDNNEIIGIAFNRDIVVQSEQVIDLVNEALNYGKTGGYIGNYAFLVQNKHYGRIVVFLDITVNRQQNENLVITTGIIGFASVIVFFFIALGLSFWLVRPVKETFEKQKLFISNASHELKTPLAVISANADVLESEIGENKWLGYISSEAERMSELVNELLCLARLEDKSGHQLNMSDFSLTDIVLQTALPFESRMFEMGKKFDVDAQDSIEYHGDPSAVKHILTILIDNAAKYSDEKGEISVKLYAKGSKKIIEVYNTGSGIPADKLDKIFERFYREDEARNSKSGGYGLGLAIAKSTVEAHGGKITVQSEYGQWVRFTVTL